MTWEWVDDDRLVFISSVFLIPFSWMTMNLLCCVFNLHPHRSGSTTRPGSARLHWNHPGAGLEETPGQDLHLQADVCVCRRATGRTGAACYFHHTHAGRPDSWHALHRHPRGRTRTEKKCSSHCNRIHRWGLPYFWLLLQHDNAIVLFAGVDKRLWKWSWLTFICMFFFPKNICSSVLGMKHSPTLNFGSIPKCVNAIQHCKDCFSMH